MKKQCLECDRLRDCQDSASAWFFLFIGLIATISVRLVNVFLDFSPFWAKLSWYVGIVGFFIYFFYKYRQLKAMNHFLTKSDIARKISSGHSLSTEESRFLSSLLCSLRSRKDSINFFFIFFTLAWLYCWVFTRIS